MCTISINLRPSGKGLESPGSLFVRAVHRREVLTLTLPYRLYLSEWNAEEHCVICPSGSALERREYLLETERSLRDDMRRLKEHLASLESKNPVYTVRDVLDILRCRRGSCLLKSYASAKAAELRLQGQERTAEAYLSAARSLLRFNGERDIPLNTLDASLIRRYEAWLKNSRLSLNTVSFYMRNLRALLNRAVSEGLIESPHANPFSQVYTGVQPTRKRALSKEEVRILDKLDFTDDSLSSKNVGLQQALDIFLFCFHARGMSFVDVAYLKKTDVRDGVISYLRRKTGQLLELRITPAMQSIIEHYEEATKDIPFLFPLIREPDKPHRPQYLAALKVQNNRLHRIERRLGWKKKLTTHVTRHSWATIAKGEHLPLWVISEGLGHANEKVTYTYLASFDRSVMDKAVDKVSAAIRRAG
ncbi:site-specific recombinase XerD [Parabacteroides sp. PF5-5]|uniref:tyrosine-type recombinase/integrase n=1 Tax=unclassified Parabacteroides TaxID=2649774 RepID=UPI002476B222|nr:MULTISPECIES: site-specific integrase [unclassified Parabacteroides]MDH6316389.1 site-specific recombinase XerD [Parabacteroides sp. PF5-13]MDH6327576.1 site-specific recombinase XerD [Parabacteroides sp. PH5-41]MDH6335284.1 site-specific recombinase XerD [Parabacteroides sp. PF5-5]MDH6346347.1 site-specific recombinase XerD [Parabacteroides sp. PH5-46]MDH6361402.1 site-specific recombinase XerD [Parabacteroides sp. PH5-16]